jgi:hypothetical protein
MLEAFRWPGSTGRTAVMLGVVALQFLVPAVALTREPPTRLGFQMYSATGGVEIEVFDRNGHELKVDYSSVVAGSFRPELQWTRRLPEYLCSRFPRAAVVEVTDSSRERMIRC